MAKKKICVVTGSRAEYGLLYWLMKGIELDKELELGHMFQIKLIGLKVKVIG